MAAGLVAAISRESLRQILRAAGISWQASKPWKASEDPDFTAEMRHMPAALDLATGPGHRTWTSYQNKVA